MSYNFGSITVLKKHKGRNLQDQDKAKQLLEDAAEQVIPLMEKYKFKVGKLVEFLPKPGLLGLNVNGGAVIKVRLRKSGSDFYDYHHIVGTLLHELTHNKHHNHSAEFYAFLDNLWKETEELMSKGIKGAGSHVESFAGKGKSLGGLSMRLASKGAQRSAAAAAAQKRVQRSKLMTSGGNVLGGAKLPIRLAGSSPFYHRQRRLDAVQRRLRDQSSCGSQEIPIEISPDKKSSSSSSSSNRSRSHSSRNVDLSKDDDDDNDSDLEDEAPRNNNRKRQRHGSGSSSSSSSSNGSKRQRKEANSSSSSSSSNNTVIDLCDSDSPPSSPLPSPPLEVSTSIFTTDEEYARSLLLSFAEQDRTQMESDASMARTLAQQDKKTSETSGEFDPTKAIIGARVVQ